MNETEAKGQMNMPDIVELATKRANAQALVTALGASNVYGLTPAEQAASSARYRLAMDALMKATQDYDAAGTICCQTEQVAASVMCVLRLILKAESTQT